MVFLLAQFAAPGAFADRQLDALIKSAPAKSFRPQSFRPGVPRSNEDIAIEFLDYTFFLENGTRLQWFTKFDGLVTVAFTKRPSRFLQRELDLLVKRFRKEANIDLNQRSAGTYSSIMIEVVSPAILNAFAPSAACFLLPGVSSLRDLRLNSQLPRTDWTQVRRRRIATVFIPDGLPQQEARDCLHEELAQALGPLNDLYRVPDSVFNDDNFVGVLTPYDMLLLKVINDPSLKSGMARTEVAIKARELINRYNPAGRSKAQRGGRPTKQQWRQQIEKALGPRATPAARLKGMNDVVATSKRLGYNDLRLGFAHYARGRVIAVRDLPGAKRDFETAYNIYRRQLGAGNVRTAQAALQLSLVALLEGDIARAQAFVTPSIKAAQRGQDGILLFRLLTVQSEIEKAKGNTNKARSTLREAIGWGKFGLGSPRRIKQAIESIAALRSSG